MVAPPCTANGSMSGRNDKRPYGVSYSGLGSYSAVGYGRHGPWRYGVIVGVMGCASVL